MVSIEDVGCSARIVDVDAGVSAIRAIGYCELSSPLSDNASLMCGGGSKRYAGRVVMESDTTKPVVYQIFSREADSALVHGSVCRH